MIRPVRMLLFLLAALATSVSSHAGVVVVENSADPAEMRGALEGIALLPASVREAALEASLYPEHVARIGGVRADTQAAFLELSRVLPAAERNVLWELIRRPEILESLVEEGRLPASLRASASGTVAAMRTRIRNLWLRHRSLLRSVAALREGERARVESLLASLPLEGQAAFRTLLRRSDAMNLLTANPELVESLGALYRGDQQATLGRLAQLHEDLARDHAAAIPGWEDLEPGDPQTRSAESDETGVAKGTEVVWHADGSRSLVLDGSIPRASDPVGESRPVWVPASTSEVRSGVPSAYSLYGAATLSRAVRRSDVSVYAPASHRASARAQRDRDRHPRVSRSPSLERRDFARRPHRVSVSSVNLHPRRGPSGISSRGFGSSRRPVARFHGRFVSRHGIR